MILVTLGTQKQQFNRLLDFIDYDKMNEYVKKADLVITHGGTGSITGPLKEGKVVIACARKSEYGEHVDDHQEQIIDVFSEEGYILKLDENINLDKLIKESKTFKAKKFKSNTNKLIEKLEKEINK